MEAGTIVLRIWIQVMFMVGRAVLRALQEKNIGRNMGAERWEKVKAKLLHILIFPVFIFLPPFFCPSSLARTQGCLESGSARGPGSLATGISLL